MANRNLYMNDQEWEYYDPAQWVLVISKRKLLFSANPPKWVEEQDEDGMKQLEVTMDRDRFVADTFHGAMELYSQKLVDEMINRELSHLMVPELKGEWS